MSTAAPSITRLAPGEYLLTDRLGNEWAVSQVDLGYGPEWTCGRTDSSRVALDPFVTLREAKEAVFAI